MRLHAGQGECRKLAVERGCDHGEEGPSGRRLEPAPRREGPSWSEFLSVQADGSWPATSSASKRRSCARSTCSSSSRSEAGASTSPARLATLQGSSSPNRRNLSMDGELEGVAFLIRDPDSKYTRVFDEVFISEGARVIKTPVRAPKANALAERFVRTVRNEVLDLTLVFGRRHLDRILRRYAEYYKAQRPHRGLDLRTPGHCCVGWSPGAADLCLPSGIRSQGPVRRTRRRDEPSVGHRSRDRISPGGGSGRRRARRESPWRFGHASAPASVEGAP